MANGNGGNGGRSPMDRIRFNLLCYAHGVHSQLYPQLRVDSMRTMYFKWRVADDPIIGGVLSSVEKLDGERGAHQAAISKYQADLQAYQTALATYNAAPNKKGLTVPQKPKEPEKFQPNPVLLLAEQQLMNAQAVYADKYENGVQSLYAGNAWDNFFGNRGRFYFRMPKTLEDLKTKYSGVKIGDLKEDGEEGKLKKAINILSFEKVNTLPHLDTIRRDVESQLEDLAKAA